VRGKGARTLPRGLRKGTPRRSGGHLSSAEIKRGGARGGVRRWLREVSFDAGAAPRRGHKTALSGRQALPPRLLLAACAARWRITRPYVGGNPRARAFPPPGGKQEIQRSAAAQEQRDGADAHPPAIALFSCNRLDLI